MSGDVPEALRELEWLLSDRRMSPYAPLYAALAEFSKRADRYDDPLQHCRTALELTQSEQQAELLRARLSLLEN